MLNNILIVLLSYSLTLLSVGCRSRAPESSGVQSFDFTKSEQFASMSDVQKKLLTRFKDQIDKALVPSHWRIYDENKKEYSREEYYQAPSDKDFYLAPIIKGLDDIYLAFKTDLSSFRGEYVVTIKSYDWKKDLKEISGTQRAILFDTSKSLGTLMAEFRSGIESSQKIANSYLERQYLEFKKKTAQFNYAHSINDYIASAIVIGVFITITAFFVYKSATTPGLQGAVFPLAAGSFTVLTFLMLYHHGGRFFTTQSRETYIENTFKSIQEKFPDKSQINDEVWSAGENPFILSQ